MFNGSTTYQRWQSYYVGQTISWSGGNWLYQQFDCDGITAGQGSTEAALGVTLPATQFVVDQVERALREAWLVELALYEFDPLLGDTTPQSAQVQVAGFTGEVVSASGGLAAITVQLGSSLSPIGAQIPPRQFSTRLIGVPCQL
jgi:hypothetical protein